MANVHTQILGRRAGARKGMVVLSVTVPNLVAAEDQNVFVADQGYQIASIEEVHAVASDAGTSHTLSVNKCTGTLAPNGGTRIPQSTINLKGAINTVVTTTLITLANTQLAVGDRIALNFSESGGAATVFGGMALTIVLIPLAATMGDTGDKRYWLSEV